MVPKNTKFGVIGKATAQVLQQFVPVDFSGDGDPSTTGKAFADLIKKETVLFPISDQSVQSIQKYIPEGQYENIIVYCTKLVDFKLISQPDILIFTSPSNVEAFLKSNTISPQQKVIAIGKTTAKLLTKCTSNPILLPWQSSELALADILTE